MVTESSLCTFIIKQLSNDINRSSSDVTLNLHKMLSKNQNSDSSKSYSFVDTLLSKTLIIIHLTYNNWLALSEIYIT